MAIRAIKFKKILDKAVEGKANYMFLGDLNSMGMNYPYNNDIEVADDLKRWDCRASQYYDMHRLPKTFNVN